jgi:hypothetical protein
MLLEIDPGKVSDMHDRGNISDETPIADAVEHDPDRRHFTTRTRRSNPRWTPIHRTGTIGISGQ